MTSDGITHYEILAVRRKVSLSHFRLDKLTLITDVTRNISIVLVIFDIM